MNSQIKTMTIIWILFFTVGQAYHVTDKDLILSSENISSFAENHQVSESISIDAVEDEVITHEEVKEMDANASVDPQALTTIASIAGVSTIREAEDLDSTYTSTGIAEEESLNHTTAVKELEANVSEEIINKVPSSEILFSEESEVTTDVDTATTGVTASAEVSTAEKLQTISSFEPVKIPASDGSLSTDLAETCDEMTSKEAIAIEESESMSSVETPLVTEISPTDFESENIATVKMNSEITQKVKEVATSAFEEEITQTMVGELTEPAVEEEVTGAAIEIETVSDASLVTVLPQVTGSESISNGETEIISSGSPKTDAFEETFVSETTSEPSVRSKIEDHTSSLGDMMAVSSELVNVEQTETSEILEITEKIEDKNDEFLSISKSHITKLRAAHSALAQAHVNLKLAQQVFDNEMNNFLAQTNSEPESV